MTVIDYAIIGGGVAGAYCAYRLIQAYPDKKIVLYERSNRIGGRLLTIKMPRSKQVSELGGMRYIPDQHKMFSNLISELGLESIPFPMGTKENPNGEKNLAYFRGNLIRIEDLKDPNKHPYHLSSNESGLSPDDLQNQMLTMFIPEWKSLNYEDWFEVSVSGKKLWQWGFWNLLYRLLTPEQYQFLKYGSGYDTNVSNGNALVLFPTGLDYSPEKPKDSKKPESKYRTLKEGMDSFPKALVAAFEKAGGVVEKNIRLHSIKREKDKNYNLEFLKTETLENEKTFYLDESPKHVKTTHVILAMPRASLESIEWEHFKKDKKLKENLSSVIKQGSVKILLEYTHAWWKSLGLIYGRSLTDLPIRQTIYFTSKEEANDTKISNKPGVLLASYNDIETIPFWKGFQKDAETFDGPDDYKAPKSMVDEAHKQITEMHGKRQLPLPISAAYYDWTQEPYGAGWHCWKANYKYDEIIEYMRHPIKSENVYICGEAYSNDQGWAEGALETAEKLLEDLIIPLETRQRRTSRHIIPPKPVKRETVKFDPLRRLRY